MRNFILTVISLIICYFTFVIVELALCFYFGFDPNNAFVNFALIINIALAGFLTDYLI